MTSHPARPYADNAPAYWRAGWRGILPLPPGRKGPPPEGSTGRAGRDPSWPDCQAWADNGHGAGNIALRLPPGIIGIDVDAYGGKPGAATLQQLQDEHGPLPATVMTTSRHDGASGIRLYRVPPGTELVAGLPGIEIIQHHHRYAVVAPSIHPEGRPYQWIDQATGEILDQPPAPAALPALPAAWATALAAHRTGPTRHATTPAETAAIILAMPGGEPCRHVRAAAGHTAKPGSRHDNHLTAVLAVLAAGRRGCPGAPAAVARLHDTFTAETTRPGPGQRTPGEAAAEWARIVDGAIGIIADQPPGDRCSDDLPEWAPPPAPTDGGQPTPFQIEVARETARLRIREAAKQQLAEEDAAAAPPLDPVGLREFLAQPDPDISWTVDGLWPAGGRVLLIAAAKSGKTTMVVRNLLPCLADGGRFLDAHTAAAPAGRILYLNMEVGDATMRRWLRGSGIRDTGRAAVANLRGKASALGIGTPAGRARFVDQLQELGASTVILDPLAPLLAALGLDEDSNSDIARFFDQWGQVMADAGCADLITHHTGHEGKRSRGASRLLDEPDAIWTITRSEPDGDDDTVAESSTGPRWMSATGRDVDLPKKGLAYEPGSGRLRLVDGTPAQQRRAVQEAGYEARILQVLSEHPGGASGRTVTRSGGSETRMRATLSRLVREGRVMEEDGPRGALYWLLGGGSGE